jgi:hypothetical protein
MEVIFAEPYRPESAEERAIWTELTAAHNYLALRRYVERSRESGTNESAAKLHESLLAEATRHWRDANPGCVGLKGDDGGERSSPEL